MVPEAASSCGCRERLASERRSGLGDQGCDFIEVNAPVAIRLLLRAALTTGSWCIHRCLFAMSARSWGRDEFILLITYSVGFAAGRIRSFVS
jgi:hypothetical protein